MNIFEIQILDKIKLKMRNGIVFLEAIEETVEHFPNFQILFENKHRILIIDREIYYADGHSERFFKRGDSTVSDEGEILEHGFKDGERTMLKSAMSEVRLSTPSKDKDWYHGKDEEF